MAKIHPTAIVDPAARLDDSVSIGPYAVIGPEVRIGAGTTVGPHTVIEGRTTIGRDNRIFAFHRSEPPIVEMDADGSHDGAHVRAVVRGEKTQPRPLRQRVHAPRSD